MRVNSGTARQVPAATRLRQKIYSRTTLLAAFAVILSLLAAAASRPAAAGDWANRDPAVEARVASLLARMTLDEKVGQLNLLSRAEPPVEQVDLAAKGRIGGMLNVLSPTEIAAFRKAAAQSRLGIPLIFGLDAVHVFRVAMPSPLGWAATWRPELAERAAEMVARETAAGGINWTFAPMVDVSRDPRWGRVIEGAGEDPFLGAAFARARVTGYRRGGVATAVKHFVGYGAAEAGRDYNGAQIPVSELFDRYLPPFKAAIDAGSETVMAAFNTVNGVPVSANRNLLTGLLRDRWAFDGVVTSDYNAIGELINHGVATNRAEAARKAILAGIDLDMEGTAYARFLADEVESGRVPMTVLDEAVARVLRLKFRMGLFDERPPPVAPSDAEIRSVAREVARHSLVLLKNKGDVLPLASSARKIALIGAAAATDYDMSWWGPAALVKPETQHLDAALRERLRPGQEMTFVPGTTDACGRSLADQAAVTAAAQEADVVVLMIAEDCDTYGEAASRAYLELGPAHQALLETVAAAGKPVVLIVDTGRPLVLSRAEPFASAILIAWQGGTEGRTALAETLVGESVPSGKLPMSFPRAVGQLPTSYDGLPTSRPSGHDRFTSRYVDEDVGPLYPFGHGLSYASFSYSNLRLAAQSVSVNGTLEAIVTVTNTGPRPAEDVVQLYIRQLVASRSRPVRQLKGFTKVRLSPGESRDVALRVPVQDLGYHDDQGNYVVEPGPFAAFAGGSSAASLAVRFEVTPAVLPSTAAER